eukprot:6003519-Alexandrium_andersonii.AAC.1
MRSGCNMGARAGNARAGTCKNKGEAREQQVSARKARAPQTAARHQGNCARATAQRQRRLRE